MVFPGIWFIFGGQNRGPYNREPVYISVKITEVFPSLALAESRERDKGGRCCRDMKNRLENFANFRKINSLKVILAQKVV